MDELLNPLKLILNSTEKFAALVSMETFVLIVTTVPVVKIQFRRFYGIGLHLQ